MHVVWSPNSTNGKLKRNLLVSNVSLCVVIFVSVYIVLHVQTVGCVVRLENPSGAACLHVGEKKNKLTFNKNDADIKQ